MLAFWHELLQEGRVRLSRLGSGHLAPLWGLAEEWGGLLPSFHIPVLEGVEAGDGLQRSGDLHPFLDGGLDSMSPPLSPPLPHVALYFSTSSSEVRDRPQGMEAQPEASRPLPACLGGSGAAPWDGKADSSLSARSPFPAGETILFHSLLQPTL